MRRMRIIFISIWDGGMCAGRLCRAGVLGHAIRAEPSRQRGSCAGAAFCCFGAGRDEAGGGEERQSGLCQRQLCQERLGHGNALQIRTGRVDEIKCTYSVTGAAKNSRTIPLERCRFRNPQRALPRRSLAVMRHQSTHSRSPAEFKFPSRMRYRQVWQTRSRCVR